VPNWIKNTIVLVVAWGVALLGIELALRMFGDDVLAIGNQSRFYRFDPELGWNNTPNSNGYLARLEYRVEVRINSQGMRDREPLPLAAGAKRIAVLGDSFTWGVGASYGERFTELLEQQLPNVDVLNYGVSGFGTTQQLVQLNNVLAAKPDYVVLALCLSNDVGDAITPFQQGYNKPFARRGGDGRVEIAGYPLINVKAMGDKLIGADSDLRLFGAINLLHRALAGPNPATKDPRFRTDPTASAEGLYTPDDILSIDARMRKKAALDIEADLLGMMNDKVTAALGAGRFLVAFVPTKIEVIPELWDTNTRGYEEGDQLLERLHVRDIDVLDPRGEFGAEDFWRRDGHWNREGHRVFARVLGEYLAEKWLGR
jgi:hypothetical protein